MIYVWFRWDNYVGKLFNFADKIDEEEEWQYVQQNNQTTMLLKIIANGKSFQNRFVDL